MSFRFRLESLLHLKRSVERQQELLLASANQRVAVLQARVESIGAIRLELQASISRVVLDGGSSSDLHFHEEQLSVLARYEQLTLQNLQAAITARVRQCEALAEARRQRQIPETLRTNQLLAYRDQQKRRDQRDADELYLQSRHSARPHRTLPSEIPGRPKLPTD